MGSFGYCFNNTRYVEYMRSEDAPHWMTDAQMPTTNTELSDGTDVRCVGEWDRYLSCISWSIGLVTGYGSEPRAGPFHRFNSRVAHVMSVQGVGLFSGREERIVLFFLFIGAFMWAYVTALFVDFISNLDPDLTAFVKGLGDLNAFCTYHRLDSKLSIRLREYYLERKEQIRAEARDEILQKLSPMLQATISWEVHKDWLSGAMPLFQGVLNKKFLVRVALTMVWHVFPPKERLPAGRLYIIRKGYCIYKSQTLGPGRTWGGQEVLAETFLSKAAQDLIHKTAYAISYVHVYTTSAEELLALKDEVGAWPSPFASLPLLTPSAHLPSAPLCVATYSPTPCMFIARTLTFAFAPTHKPFSHSSQTSCSSSNAAPCSTPSLNTFWLSRGNSAVLSTRVVSHPDM